MRLFKAAYANDSDALIPELWARFGLAVLESNLVAAQLVHRDFESDLANFGDVVNTRKPAEFKAKRKTDTDNVTVQDASVTNIPVKLDMHPHVSFLIRDGEESQALTSLVDYYLVPAMSAMAEHIDACILGQAPRFMIPGGVGGQTYGITGGSLGGLSATTYQQYLTELAEGLDKAKCPLPGRQIVVPPAMKRLILQNQTLVGADQRGDTGTALKTADIGDIYGFRHYMCQNASSVAGSDTVGNFQVNLAAGYAKGVAVITIDTGTGVIATGTWVKLGSKPYQVTAHTETAGNTTSITISPALRAAVTDNAVITVYDPGAVNLAAGYAAGWQKPIAVDSFTAMPAVGQFVSFGTANANVYTVVDADATTITLDRPLVAALADNDLCNIAPDGDYGFAFHRNAVALVVRPLRLPRAGAGALAGIANHNGLSMRVVISYDADKQGHLVTLDCLMGVTVLDKSYGGVLLG